MASKGASDILEDFGRRIGELRRERRWTQQVLADRLGVSVKYVERVEAGRENLTLESIALLASVFKTKPMELLRAPRSRAARRRGRPRLT